MKTCVKTLLITIFIISTASAGVVMTTQFQNLQDKKAQPSSQTTYLEKNMIRMDMQAEKTNMSVIFNSSKETFWMVDHKKKTYTEMTKEDLEKIQKAAEEMMTKMDEAMKNLPPALQNKMKNLTAPKENKKNEIIYTKVASDEKVNQWICDKYVGKRNDTKEAEVWTADWKKLGYQKEDLAGLEQLGKFFASMLKNMSWAYQVGADEKAEHMYFGFPVKTINYEKDKATDQYEIKEIKQEELAATVFEIPKGYKKEKMETEK